jgi:heme/copper-type cytochrome/quinol oxidase subunit 2
MSRPPSDSFQSEKRKILSGYSFFFLLFMAFIVVLSVRFAWRGGKSILEGPLTIIPDFAFLWMAIVGWRYARAVRTLNAKFSWEFLFGPRPQDIDELRVWWWGRQFLWMWLTVALCMGIFVLVIWLRGG